MSKWRGLREVDVLERVVEDDELDVQLLLWSPAEGPTSGAGRQLSSNPTSRNPATMF